MDSTREAVEASHRATEDLGQTAANLTNLVDQFTT
jgi:methyl-accepting chemotaxis protein